MAPDYATEVGKLRALIPDVEELPNPNDPYGPHSYLFEDAHLEAILSVNNGNLRLAAADACEVLGTSEGYIAKVIKTEDLQTDGAKLMGQFLVRARELRRRAREEEASEDVDGFDIVPYVVPRPNRRYWLGGFGAQS